MRGPRSMYKKARDPRWTTKATTYAAKRLRIPSAALDLALPSPVKSRRRKSQPPRHLEDPLVVNLEGCLGHSAYFSTALIDNCKYTKGNLVAVAAGDDANKKRMHEEATFSRLCGKALAASAWFCQVMYFFVDAVHGVKMAHVQWFMHGSRVLGELGHPNELFLIDECDDIPVSSIIQKCSLHKLALGEDSALKYEEGEFFGRLRYGEEFEFTDFHDLKTCSRLLEHCPTHKPCINCGLRAEQQALASVQQVYGGLSRSGEEFHIGDFAYILPALEANEQRCLLLAQILQVDWECHCLHVRYWERQGSSDTSTRTDTVDIARLDGKFFVRAVPAGNGIESWVTAHPDNFFTIPQRATRSNQRTETPVNSCGTCYFQHCADLKQLEEYSQLHGPVSVLDVCCGAGGLSQGLTQSVFFEVELAVDQDILAANTFRENNPRSTVVCTDLNSFLKFSSDRKRGKITNPLVSSDGGVIPNHTVPRLLNLGVLCGDLKNWLGTPCGSFSAANRHKVCISSIPLVMAGLASIYRPKFVVFENVPEFIHHSINDPLGDGLIEQAMLKAMCRSLMDAGFQVRIGILNAAQHGCAQNRSRFIILGARRGLKLPNLPALSHTSNSPHKYSLFLKGEFVPRATRHSGTATAPHPLITLDDAINDLGIQGDVQKAKTEKCMSQTASLCQVHQDAASGDTYKILDKDAPFNTLLTKADPRSGNCRSLHPTPQQQRSISTREAARAQGFPDDYNFVSDRVKDIYKLIGNAVPVPLAAAISRTLSTALITSPNLGGMRDTRDVGFYAQST
ncbi:S-adenosyl-L-methionine-dependent methyltransferase [Favolaschia claudopus]|uniref:DNA (cytosine-5-)-methyltransferase n=1 Tax=Favolaschia claudopus TaxID=2862362 RepID=A0AAW0AEF1_9AGAR